MTESLCEFRDHEAIVGVCDALLIACADLPCSNGCGCEEFDYCAQDLCRSALLRLRIHLFKFGVPDEGSVKPGDATVVVDVSRPVSLERCTCFLPTTNAACPVHGAGVTRA